MQVDQSLAILLKYSIASLTQVGFYVFFPNGQTLLVQGTGHPMTVSGVSCAAAILSGYNDNHAGVTEDIISRKWVATDGEVGTEWAHMYKTVIWSVFLKDSCCIILVL